MLPHHILKSSKTRVLPGCQYKAISLLCRLTYHEGTWVCLTVTCKVLIKSTYAAWVSICNAGNQVKLLGFAYMQQISCTTENMEADVCLSVLSQNLYGNEFCKALTLTGVEWESNSLEFCFWRGGGTKHLGFYQPSHKVAGCVCYFPILKAWSDHRAVVPNQFRLHFIKSKNKSIHIF